MSQSIYLPLVDSLLKPLIDNDSKWSKCVEKRIFFVDALLHDDDALFLRNPGSTVRDWRRE